MKNTLVKIAVKGTALDTDEFNAQPHGPDRRSRGATRIPSAAAKVVKEFRKDERTRRSSTIKCGVSRTR